MKTQIIFPVVSLFITCGIAYISNSQVESKQSDLNQSSYYPESVHTQLIKKEAPKALINPLQTNNLSTQQANLQNLPKILPEDKDRQIFQQIVKNAIAHNLASKSMSEIMQTVAESFLGAKYQAGLLDRGDRETLVISLQEFDCLLFVETVLALSRSIALQEYNYQTFVQHIVEQRYWHGDLNGYCSRLHYFSDWIYDNQTRRHLQDISLALGGISQHKKLDFMSKNRNLYPRLINNNKNYQCIVEMENSLNNQYIPTNYIPKTKIKSIYNQLQPGDIIGVTTNISGLDVTHTGLVYDNYNGVMGFIHASPIGRVTIAPDLQNYVNNIKNSTGIVVVRPINPRID